VTSLAKHAPPTLGESAERPAIDTSVTRAQALAAAVTGEGRTAPEARPPETRPGKSRARTPRRAREYQRIAVRCGCWLEHEQATVYGTTVDLGRGGLFLRTALPMPPGISVRVTLRLPGHETVVADGKIVRTVAPHAGDRPGLGVRFEHLPDGEDSLCAFLFGSLRDEQEAAALGSAALVS
jgi:uncharacterized protein (TIGR02266 family)